jgi:hypothetical protein
VAGGDVSVEGRRRRRRGEEVESGEGGKVHGWMAFDGGFVHRIG